MGLVTTASHNPMKDNGVKILDTNGGYLRMNLEPFFNKFVNESDLKKAINDY